MPLLPQLLHEPIQAFRSRIARFDRNAIFTAFLLSLIIVYSLVLTGYPAITFPWYFNTEEFPYIQEILRFVEFDFRQQFFDMPGTPLIVLGTIFWSIYYWSSVLFGYADPSEGVRYFSFEHMQSLYLLMRVISYFFYILSIVLTYLITRRLTNSVGGLVAASLLSLSPIYGLSVLYLRIESLSLALVLLSVWLILIALHSHSYKAYFLSGTFAGFAMAARFPSGMAILPVLFAYCAVFPQFFSLKKQKLSNNLFSIAITFLLLSASSISLLFRFKLLGRSIITDTLLLTADGTYPKATNTIQSLWMLLFLVAALVLLFAVLPITRAFLQKLIHSSFVTVSSGFLVGMFLGVPTILWSGNYLLASIENFSVRNKVGQNFIASLYDFVKFFLFGLVEWWKPGFVPPTDLLKSAEIGVIYTYLHVLLLIAGLVIIAKTRNRLFYPILMGAILGILCQYGKLQTTRHLIAWLPYFLMIMALPVALLYEKYEAIAKHKKQVYYLFSLVAITLIFTTTYKIQVNSIQVLRGYFQEKLVLLSEMDQWLNENTQTTEKVFHVCCEPINEETIFDWMQRNGVKIPKGIRKSDQAIIWFGDKEPLTQVKKGYIVISTNSFPGQYVDYYKKMRPESLTDPFTDSHFSLEKVVDPGLKTGTTYQIYRFDFTNNHLGKDTANRKNIE
jgi:hypothetical protein